MKGYEDKEEYLHSLLRHDLKNKLQISQGYFQLLMDEDLPEGKKDFIKKGIRSLKESTRLIETVRSIRNVKKDDVGKVDINRMIDSAIQEFSEMLEKEDINVDFQKTDQMVIGAHHLKDLFIHLIDNAITHSNCDHISIYFPESYENVKITFEDDGEGLPSRLKDDLFEPGTKGKDSSGSGLGLNLVKEVAEKYDGEVKFEEPDSGGARFVITLQKAS